LYKFLHCSVNNKFTGQEKAQTK